MNNPTRPLRYAHLAATGGLVAVGIGTTTTDWRLITAVLLWGFLTGVWAFSAGWDARDEHR